MAAALDRLYEAFAQVPRPSAIEYCLCCFDPQDEHALLTPTPLRQLPAETLQPYAANVMFTVGSSADFRYFLPRLFEIACDDGFGWPDMEPLVSRLRYAQWTTWQSDERDAVRGFLSALWSYSLACHPDEAYDIDAILCAIGNAEVDLTPYLTEWTTALARPTAAAQLRYLLSDGCRSDGMTRRLTNAFWRDRDAQAAQVVAWFSSDDLRLAVADAFDVTYAEQTLQTLTDINELL